MVGGGESERETDRVSQSKRASHGAKAPLFQLWERNVPRAGSVVDDRYDMGAIRRVDNAVDRK